MKHNLSQGRIPRKALMKLLDKHLNKRAIYFFAPAGFGKTQSAQSWLMHREVLEKTNYTFISLDEFDNITSEFCRRFVIALTALESDNHTISELATTPAFNSAPVEFTLRALSSLSEEKGKRFSI